MLLVAATLALALTLPRESPPAQPRVEPITVQGKIREIGGGPGGRPQAVIVADGKQRILHTLDPVFREELRRLSGLVVKIFGVTGDPRTAAPNHVLVDRYEIIEIKKGVVPRVGHLALLQVGPQRRLVFVDKSGKADLLPKGWSQKMRRHAGAKVWIVGRRDKDGSFRPQRFSILRAADPDADQ